MLWYIVSYFSTAFKKTKSCTWENLSPGHSFCQKKNVSKIQPPRNTNNPKASRHLFYNFVETKSLHLVWHMYCNTKCAKSIKFLIVCFWEKQMVGQILFTFNNFRPPHLLVICSYYPVGSLKKDCQGLFQTAYFSYPHCPTPCLGVFKTVGFWFCFVGFFLQGIFFFLCT